MSYTYWDLPLRNGTGDDGLRGMDVAEGIHGRDKNRVFH